MKRTKIICTIGPASHSKTRLQQMMRAGMDIARLNFSHGNYSDHARLIRTIREASKAVGKPIALLQDLQGPRIRIGELPAEGVSIRKGDTVALVSQVGLIEKNSEVISLPIQYRDLYKVVKKKGHIYIQDGMIDVQVERIVGKTIITRVIQGGRVFSHKGINVPGVTVNAQVITKKDKEDLVFGISQGVDYIALSFVKDASNIRQLRKLLTTSKGIKIIAKIERREAVKNFRSILKEVDGIMVARGDLGVELGPAEVPILQKEMIFQCLKAAKPVIVATQMLESMVENPRPTRAEAADVANAIIDHTDAIMLSAESATGKYPAQAVRTMTQIAKRVEKSRFDDIRHDLFPHRNETQSRGVAHAAAHLAESIGARAIAVLTDTGATATLVSQLRPQHSRIVAFTHDTRVLRQLMLVWGVYPLHMSKPKNKQAFVKVARGLLLESKYAKKGDSVVIVTGFGLEKGLGLSEVITI